MHARDPAPAREGSGALAEIGVAATLKKKLDLAVPQYKIPGACNPRFASQAPAVEMQVGALPPCNVVLRQDAAGEIPVEFIDPVATLQRVERPQVHAIAGQVRERRARVMSGL